MSSPAKKIVILLGPTAVGKSTLGVVLAPKFGMEIINADSQQVWKEFDIGTAKPSKELRKKIPHYLIDIVSPAENFDANRFLTLADEAIADITRRGKKVLVIGGTGMYLRMLLKGHCEAPGRDEEIRKELRERIEKEGLASLYQDLRKIDLPSAQLIHPNDPIRIVRALEVWKLTGIPLSEFHERHHFQENRYMALQIGLNVDR